VFWKNRVLLSKFIKIKEQRTNIAPDIIRLILFISSRFLFGINNTVGKLKIKR
jgi:hypothetical protein